MMTVGKFYRQTWWLWLIFAALIAGLCYFVSEIFLFGFPIMVVYSIFFAITRVKEIRQDEQEAESQNSKSAAN
jgi:membrane protein implicated in regulation of membrane protease activity